MTAAVQECALTSSSGETLQLTAKVFEAFHEMMLGKKNGSVTVQFNAGGVAGVKLERILK